MPTRPGFDLVSVRTETKEQLARLKGSRTYDELIQSLLEGATNAAAPPDAKPRDPEEQVALAELAARRWERWLETGQVRELGPRLFAYYPKTSRRSTRVEWSGRRGFEP